MSADIHLSGAARDQVQRAGGVFTLPAAPQHGFCGGRAAVPMAEARVPDTTDGLKTLELAGIKVYLLQALAEGPCNVELTGFRRWQRLVVEGAGGPWRA